MPNVTRGGRMHGLVQYVVDTRSEFKDGKRNVHTDPHLVAGDSPLMAWHSGHELSRNEASQIANYLDAPSRTHDTKVMVKARDSSGNEVVDEATGRPKMVDAHVWHCSLSVKAGDDGQLGDEKWGTIAEDFMSEMGLVDPDDPRAPARWAAFHHGQSEDGHDHIHIVMNVVREDGTKVNLHNDMPRSQKVANLLEKRHGLTVLASREGVGNVRSDTPHEARERKAGAEPYSQRTANLIRSTAAQVDSEAEFVRALRTAGASVRCRWSDASETKASGWSIAGPVESGLGAPKPGGRFGADLTLPQLRKAHGWAESDADAAAEWARANRGMEPTREAEPAKVHRIGWTHQESAQLTRDVDAVTARLKAAKGDPAVVADVAHDASGAFAAWAKAYEEVHPATTLGEDVGRDLADAAQVLARSAQVRAHATRRPPPQAPSLVSSVMLIAAATRGQAGRTAQALMLMQMVRLMRAIADAKRAAQQEQEAARLEAAITERVRALVPREHAGPHAVAALDERMTVATRPARRLTEPVPAASVENADELRSQQPPTAPMDPEVAAAVAEANATVAPRARPRTGSPVPNRLGEKKPSSKTRPTQISRNEEVAR